MPIGKDAHQTNAVLAVLEERDRQDRKWGEQNHEMFVWLAILSEEVGELSEAVLHKQFGGIEAENVRTELTQVAAVALQMIEFLNRRPA